VSETAEEFNTEGRGTEMTEKKRGKERFFAPKARGGPAVLSLLRLLAQAHEARNSKADSFAA
jgi:hypothetical protein